MPERLAFIGLGIMGGPMAGHLLAGGHALVVHTRTKARAAPLLDAGAAWVASPAAAAASADVVFTCVTDTPDVEAVLTGPGGVIESARAGTIVVDHSTISPTAARAMAQRLAARGVTLLDAPVSGGDVGARDATLSIMVGGDPAALARVRPLLGLMGRTVTHCGPVGAGQLTKLTNQILVAGTLLAVAEAMAFATANGLDGGTTIAATAGGAAGSWQLANLGPKMLAGDYRPGFMVDLAQKDFRLVLAAATEAHIPLPATTLVHNLLTRAQEQGHGRDGTQAIYDVVRGDDPTGTP